MNPTTSETRRSPGKGEGGAATVLDVNGWARLCPALCRPVPPMARALPLPSPMPAVEAGGTRALILNSCTGGGFVP